jgi:exodeoxyribonuclease VII large subunit
MEDLWAFNEEHVARAIFESEIPIVSAVGHETDFTVADFVADLRAPTPSAAAEMVAAESSDLKTRIDELKSGLRRVIGYDLLRRRALLRDLIESRGFAETARSVLSLSARRRELESRVANALLENLRSARSRLDGLQRRLDSTDFRATLLIKASRLESADQRIKRAIQRLIERKQHGLAVGAGKLDMLSPLAVLGRGYVLVKDEDGRLVARAAPLSEGQNLTLRFEDGSIACQVKRKEDFQVTRRDLKS